MPAFSAVETIRKFKDFDAFSFVILIQYYQLLSAYIIINLSDVN